MKKYLLRDNFCEQETPTKIKPTNTCTDEELVQDSNYNELHLTHENFSPQKFNPLNIATAKISMFGRSTLHKQYLVTLVALTRE